MKLLKFEASWCQPCKQLSKVMETLTFPFTVEAVDVDQNRDAAIEYGVRGVPCLILLDENGNTVTRINGTVSKQQLIETFQATA